MNTYENPLVTRYCSDQMQFIFSPKFKFTTWRKLWVELARIQKELGLTITDEQIRQMEDNIENIDFEKAAYYEKQFRHDVMAHVHTFGDVAPLAKPIIHLGATSAFVGDNTDLIQIKEALILVRNQVVGVIKALADFAKKYHDLPTLGFTHYQPAQLTTVGKRATLWIQSLLFDLEEVEFRLENLRFRGVKGTTGTAASFKELFDGDYQKVIQLDDELTKRFGFQKKQKVSGQTYDRKVDAFVLQTLSGIAQSAHKFTNDLRLLQNLKEVEEPFEKDQIGSSAMAYKRNPMRSERIASLSKFVIALSQSTSLTAATQWFERTLDDSANKRLAVPQCFLAIDAILNIWLNIAQNMVVYPKTIQKHIEEELPFMVTEYIIMEGVKNGGDRQELHEKIRQHSMEAARVVKELGCKNDLLERISNDADFPLEMEKLVSILKPENFTGFAAEQTLAFLSEEVQPILEKYSHINLEISDLKV